LDATNLGQTVSNIYTVFVKCANAIQFDSQLLGDKPYVNGQIIDK